MAEIQHEKNDSSTERNEHDAEDEIHQECKCCADVNRNLLPSKLFYFFFFGANGTLMPYLVLFFKQLGLSPSQVGIVTGFKPFISFFFTPIWGYIADKTNRTKWIFILSVLAYVGGYFAYSFSPAKHVCKLRTNSTKHHQPIGMSHVHKRNIDQILYSSYNAQPNFISTRQRRMVIGKYFRRVSDLNNKENVKKSKKDFIPHSHIQDEYSSFIPTDMSTSLYQLPNHLRTIERPERNTTSNQKDKQQTKQLFSFLDNNTETEIDINESPLDMFEASWGSALQSHKSPWTICAAARANSADNINFTEDIKAYVNINAIFSYLLVVTVVATVFSCPLITIVDTATIRKLKDNDETHKYGKQRLWGSLGWGLTSFGVGAIISMIPLCPGMNNEVNYYPAFYVFAVLLLIALVIGLKLQFTVPEENSDEQNATENLRMSRPKRIFEGLKLMRDPTYCCFIVTSFYIGITMSIIKTFLFWHLKDIGGTQLLFSIAAAINCCAEVFVYYFSPMFIKRVGHIRVLYIALVCYSLRLYYYGLLTNPWYVLAAEPLSGITTAAAWAAMTSYVGLNATPESVTTHQGILHGIHWGLGHGCGELIGGFMVSWIGAAMTFNVFGTLSLVQLLLFASINWFTNRKHLKSMKADQNSGSENAKFCCD